VWQATVGLIFSLPLVWDSWHQIQRHNLCVPQSFSKISPIPHSPHGVKVSLRRAG